MRYLSEMTDHQTLVMYSGHPMGLFPSHPDAPRVVITNGMMIPNHSTKENYEKLFATGNTQYGNMTAGSWMYIGPQGIVHGTMITILNACRRYLTDREPGRENDFSDVVYLTSGLGGMSGAQPKAGLIAGTISVTAEVDGRALQKRYEQGWVQEIVRSPAECIERVRRAKRDREPVSIAYHGNVVDLWEAFADESELNVGEKLIDLGSDQTSLHNPWMGGYYPVQLTFDESLDMMRDDPEQFKGLVQESLRRHIAAINRLSSKGTKFWDYGNGFLLESSRAGADVMGDSPSGFKYPSCACCVCRRRHRRRFLFLSSFLPFLKT
jgi:urocanate hydratase